MWIQIRTIDGKETRTVEDLSRLTKIESLRVKIRDIFDVKPEQQRLFYRGKQVRSASDPLLALAADPDSSKKLPACAIHWCASMTPAPARARARSAD